MKNYIGNKLTEKPVTHSSTAKREEKQEERGSCQTLPILLESAMYQLTISGKADEPADLLLR